MAIGEVGEQRLSPFLNATIDDGFDGGVHRVRVCQFYTHHREFPFTSRPNFSWLNCDTSKLFVPHARSAAHDVRSNLVTISISEPR